MNPTSTGTIETVYKILDFAADPLALFDGLDYLPPEPVREAAVPVIAHRLGLDPQARYSGRSAEDVVRGCLEGVTIE